MLAGWCYYGGCHADAGAIFEKACPSMADSVGRNNMYILFETKCDTWHERLWGKKHFCCTNDCQYRKCGKSCAQLGMNPVEENDYTKPQKCTFTSSDGDEYTGVKEFCC